MNLPYAALTQYIEQGKIKQIVRDALISNEELFKQIKKIMPAALKIPGFSSVRRIPFSNSKALIDPIVKYEIYQALEMATLLFKAWCNANSDVKEVVQKELEQNNYEINDLNFDDDYFEIKPLERKDVYENNGNSYFRPNGKELTGFDEEDTTIMAALYGWSVMPDEFFDETDTPSDEGTIDDLGNNNSTNIQNEIPDAKKSEDPQLIIEENNDEFLKEFGELENSFFEESDSLSAISKEVKKGNFIDLQNNSERLGILKDKVFALAEKINYPDLSENSDLNSIKSFYIRELEQKKSKNAQNRSKVQEFLYGIKLIAVKKGDTPDFVKLIKEKANEYISKIEDENILEDEWFTNILRENHFFNHLKKAIEISLQQNNDIDAIDELLDKLKNMPQDFNEKMYDQLTRQILRKNLYFTHDNDPEPDEANIDGEEEESESVNNAEVGNEPESSNSKNNVSDVNEPDECQENQQEEAEEAISRKEEKIREDDIFEENIEDDLSYEDKEIIKLLLNDEPYLAFHLAKCFEKLEINLLLPSPLLENICLSPIIRSETGQVAQKMADNFREITFNFEKTDTGHFINQILFAILLRPSLFAYHTSGAVSFLELVHSGKNAEFDALKKLLTEFMNQKGYEVNFEKLHLAFDEENFNERKEQFKTDIERWLEKAEIAKFRNNNHPYSIAFKRWVKGDGKIRKALSEFTDNQDFESAKNLLKDFIDQNLWTKEFDRQLKEIAGNSKKIYDNTEARRWISNQIEGLRDIIDQGNVLFNRNNYEEILRSDFFKFIQEFKNELEEFKKHLLNLSSETLLDKVAKKYLNNSIINLEELFSGEEKLKIRPDLTQLKYASLLKLPFYESSFDMSPVDYNHQLKDSIVEYGKSLPMSINQILQQHLNSGNFEAYNRMLNIWATRDYEVKTVNDQQDFINLFEYKCKKIQTSIERGCLYGYITDHKRAHLFSDLDNLLIDNERIDETIPEGINFPLRAYWIKTIEDKINGEKLKMIERYENTIDNVSESRMKEILQNYLNEGNITLLTDSLQRIKNGAFSEYEKKHDYFNEYFNEFLTSKESNDSSNIIRKIENREKISVADFRSISDHQLEEAVSIMNQWFLLKNNRDMDVFKEFDSYKRFLDGIGFIDSEKTEQGTHGKAVYFDFKCNTIKGRNKTPLPRFGSFAKGKYRLISIIKKMNEDDLLEQIKELEPVTERATIIFNFTWMDQNSRLEVFRLSKRRRLSFLLLDQAMLIYLLGIKESRFPVFVKLSSPFSFVEPYQTGASNLPEEMFYGRANQIKNLKNYIGHFSCLIYGGRQLGKTVLQKETERQFHNPEQKQYAIYIDLRHNGIGGYKPIEEIKEVLIENLKIIPDLVPEKLPANIGLNALMDKLRLWFTQNEEGRVLLFLDESDNFLEQDSKKDWENILPLKGLMEITEKRFKVILAGLHDVRRTIRIPNNPLAHFGNPICVGPMLGEEESLEAQLLVKLPLETLGYKFESDDLVLMVLSHCNWYPSLIQIFCSGLLNILREKINITSLPVIITEKEITRAYETSRANIKEKFNLTLGLDERYNLLANVIAAKIFETPEEQISGSTVKDITEIALLSWQEGFDNANPHIDIRNLLEEMVDLGILRNVSNGNFTLRSANLLGMIGNQNQIEEYLFNTKKSLPAVFNRDVSRIIYNKDYREKRSPFPAIYYDIIMRPENKVIVFRGSKLSGIEYIEEFLGVKREITIYPIGDKDEFDSGLEEIAKIIDKRKPVDKKRIFVVSPNSRYNLKDVLATNKKFENKTDQTVLFLMDPETYWRFMQEDFTGFDKMNNQLISVVNMPLWKKQIISEWFRETGGNAADLDKIINVTGYWHYFIDKIHEIILSNPGLWEEELKSFENKIISDKDRYLNEFGLINNEMRELIEILNVMDGSISKEEFITENGIIHDPGKSEMYLNYFLSLNLIQPNLKVDDVIKKCMHG